MPNNSFAVVEPPVAAPPRVSLLASAQEISDGTRWQAGITFEPVGCGQYGGFHVPCNPGGETPESLTVKSAEVPSVAIVEYEPYTVWHADACSTATFQSRDFSGRALARYVANESAYMAQELWDGAVATGAGYPNFYLANGDSDDVGNGVAFTADLALARLQDAAFSSGGYAGRVMVHAPRDIASLWYRNGIVRREGALLVDAFDNIVVADGGYSGTGPEGQTRTDSAAWIYATDMVQVRRDGQVKLLPSTEEVMAGAAMDRDVNFVEWRVERLVAAYPAGCLHLAIEVDLCANECPEPS